MTVEVKKPKSLDDALSILMELSDKYPDTEFVFRGQPDIGYRLKTSYDRYWVGTPWYDEFFIDRMVFLIYLKSFHQ